MSTPTSSRSLYRHLWRTLGHLPNLDPPRLTNLRRLLRPQLRQALADPHVSLNDLTAQGAPPPTSSPTPAR